MIPRLGAIRMDRSLRSFPWGAVRERRRHVEAPELTHKNERYRDMNCPICGATAQQGSAATQGVAIVCPTCGEYEVSSSVLTAGQLRKLEPQQRRTVLDDAKRSAQPGTRPVITSYLLDCF
jgi:hypothetical protein